MKVARNRERILEASVELFNQSGVVAVTTNHIAEHLGISPGNLYFHFRNKEQILAELFDRMCVETYETWSLESASAESPRAFVEAAFETFWKYRFFHREMYHMRRKDPVLAQKWRLHMQKTIRLLRSLYAHWVKTGSMRKASDPAELRAITDTVLIASSWFLQFFESPEKPATRRAIKQGTDHVMRMIAPYCAEPVPEPSIESVRRAPSSRNERSFSDEPTLTLPRSALS